jgi:hypothetical protein
LCQSALNFGLNGPGSLKTELHNKQEPPEVSSFFVLAEPEEYNLANSNSVSVWIRTKLFLMESLILAQNERWRRG